MPNARLIALAALLALAGCEWLDNLQSPKVDNPVMPPPPPRMSLSDDRPNASRAKDGSPAPVAGARPESIRQVSVASETAGPNGDLSGSQVVATVNGSPILASEVLERYGTRLDEVQGKATPAQLQAIRRQLIERDLETHIERTLLVDALHSTLSKEQQKQLEEFIDRAFEKEIDRLKDELKVATKGELEAELAKQGTSLSSLRDMFANREMARAFLGEKTKTKTVVGRPELLAWYESHRDDYTTPAQVRWQEIFISYDQHGGKEGAFKLVETVVAEIKNGTDFGELARRHSDGPTASKDGHWGWTRTGSLADKKIEQALFQSPEGVVRQVFDGEQGFHLLKIVERRPERVTPFEQVQDGIRQKLEQETGQQVRQRVLDDLRSRAVIRTIFDEPQTADRS